TAINSYEKATEINPDFSKAWFYMGCTYFDKKDYNNAIQFIEKALQMEPNLGKDVQALIEDLRITINKLQEALNLLFINK
ncbi:MAG: tetratricopeptide repeat protein, partial [Candidatus Thorarchaeota archaeon]